MAAWTEAYTLSASISTSEISIISGTTTLQNNTTKGTYQLFLDLSALAKGDRYRVRIYEKVRSASTKRLVFNAAFYNAQSELPTFPMLMLGNGWDMTLQKEAGTDRTLEASIRAYT